MFKTFKNKEERPSWLDQIEENQTRWFIFLEKLEAKMAEFCEAAIPELKDVHANDTDIYKRAYQQLLSGIIGQLDAIRNQANKVYAENIENIYNATIDNVSISSPYYERVENFRNVCSDRYNFDFEKKYLYWRDALNQTSREDLEAKYQNILNEFENIKNRFSCQQCGGSITIEKIFFITTFISCPHCQTQNTFEPSTQARTLQLFAQSLAEQRTAPLLDAYTAENSKERELYYKIHEIHLSTIHEKDKKILMQKQELEKALEKQRQEVIKNAPQLYVKYLRAMFDEWNKIIPDFIEHNEKIYQTQLKQFRTQN